MKSFQQMTIELNEAKVKLPSGHKQLKNEVVKAGSKKYDLTYSQKGKEVFVFFKESTKLWLLKICWFDHVWFKSVSPPPAEFSLTEYP